VIHSKIRAARAAGGYMVRRENRIKMEGEWEDGDQDTCTARTVRDDDEWMHLLSTDFRLGR